MTTPELHDDRQHLIDQLGASAEAFCAACRAVAEPFEPVEAGGWNTHQVATHVRDVDAQVYGMRIRRSAAEESPLFPNFDQEVWMAEHYHPDEPLDSILDELSASVKDLVELLRSLLDPAWSRPSRHETNGDFILQTWVERSLSHLKEHLETVEKAANS
jgi:hypothetical protein